jgi:hypothetical protein
MCIKAVISIEVGKSAKKFASAVHKGPSNFVLSVGIRNQPIRAIRAVGHPESSRSKH